MAATTAAAEQVPESNNKVVQALEDSAEKGANSPEEEEEEPSQNITYAEIFKSFLVLGWTAFGGPAAHVALFQKRFVGAGKWMTEAIYAELLALGQCLPGPTSTQVSFALGVTQRGVSGGLMSGLLFQYPGAVAMTLLGLLAKGTLKANSSELVVGATAGLAAAGVALVASAALALGRKLCAQRDTQLIALLSCVVVCYITRGWLFPLVLFLGGLHTYIGRPPPEQKAADNDDAASSVQYLGLNRPMGGVLIFVWLAALIALPIYKDNLKYEDAKQLHWFESFYRTGSIIWGGGQVVLPLLQHELVSYDTCCIGVTEGCGTTSAMRCVERRTVDTSTCKEECDYVSPSSWVTEEQFFAGLGLAQAMPGPLFNFAGYLGAVMGGVPGACVCWLGLFGPGIMLIYGVLPFWGKFRKNAVYRRMLPGLNASAVGLIVASVFKMMFSARGISRFPDFSLGIGLVAFAGVEFVKLDNKVLSQIQAPIVVVCGGILGLIAAAAGAH
ncbi:chromate ion transporter [Pycnococcus provasolii]